MARQNKSPVTFSRTTRPDAYVTMTSGRAGVVVPIDYIPMLPGDSASGQAQISVTLGEMPRPLLNGVILNVQAWFVPKMAHPQFSGPDEFIHSFQGTQISQLGAADRDPPAFYTSASGAALTALQNSDLFQSLGIHVGAVDAQADLVDAFNLIYNFRLAAHSSRLTRRPYYSEDATNSVTLPPAFWPSGQFQHVVPDYERALIVGALDLDVLAGQMPVTQLWKSQASNSTNFLNLDDATTSNASNIRPLATQASEIFAEMEGQQVSITLADIDKARTTQAFARLRTAYAGNDATGFDNDDTIVAHLMQGLSVPQDQFKRPWLLDSKRVPFGFSERFATDAANLDASVSEGRTRVSLSLNVPRNDYGGVIMITAEVLPERIFERASDEWLHVTDPDDLPNALRDVQRPEPVDLVLNRRIDARHTTPGGLYGYEPMNYKWRRMGTRLGGAFYQADPENPFTEQRAAIWQTSLVDPEFTADHWLAPAPFPHDVFSDTLADAFECVCRHSVSIVGLTQMGDPLAENNDDYDAVAIPAEE